METWNQTASDEVRIHTPVVVNRRIDEHVESCVRYMAQKGDRAEMSRYLERLEREWDINRTVAVGAAAASALGLLLGRRDGGGWRVLSGVAAAVLLQQGLFGFGPMSALLRLMGVRTRREIDLEKFAIKALRGDFERIPNDGGPLAKANAALVAAQS
ncbi:DUF2892 domain-containing protein [Pyxidicoccus parkwayensis]|uniref:DUF2892 domain-containing protein n=1 Tax=Pyxidicoccus parkwayensis TaxID=2813578 RepID=A0ABX7NR70_9BACT|nr:DUF2892 domain-containing protein [Pyxidicoccus parkwaysis]QSQ18698.1 DUF2892 domain-containing protein [Pyxidicoccus parkwaysis]